MQQHSHRTRLELRELKRQYESDLRRCRTRDEERALHREYKNKCEAKEREVKVETHEPEQDYRFRYEEKKKSRVQKEKEEIRAVQDALEKSTENTQSRRLKEKESNDMASQMADLNLCIYEMPSDGDCLFHALAHQLRRSGIEFTTQRLRAMAVEEIMKDFDYYRAFFDEEEISFEEHLKRVREQREWGGEMELQVLARTLNKKILVYQGFFFFL